MRCFSCLCLFLALAGLPAAAQGERQTLKIVPQYRHAAALGRVLSRAAFARPVLSLQLRSSDRAVAEAVRQLIVLVDPVENCLILQGEGPGLDVFRSALAVVDVPIDRIDGGERMVVTLLRGDPAAIRKETLAMPGNGRVRVDGKTLRFEGSREWLEAAVEVVVRAELPMLTWKPAETEAPQGFAKYGLRHQDPAEFFDVVRRAVGESVTVVPAYAEGGLAFRGGVDDLVRAGTALQVIDVPVEMSGSTHSVTVTLRRADPDKFQALCSLAPVGAAFGRRGSVSRSGRSFRLQGDPAWIRFALGCLFGMEVGGAG